MAHLRRFHFQSRRCCSTPAVASLPDFTDSYLELIKKKIRRIDESRTNIAEEVEQKTPSPPPPVTDGSKSKANVPPRPEPPKVTPQPDHSCCKDHRSHPDSVADANVVGDKAVVFTLHNQVGGLVRALRVFQELGINVLHIESRKSRRRDSEFEIYVDIDCAGKAEMSELVHHLRHEVDGCTLEEFERSQRRSTSDSTPKKKKLLLTQPSVENVHWSQEMLLEGMPWFPRHVTDIDLTANRVLMYGSELEADHPGFKDPVYRERRKYFIEIAMSYKHGETIPVAEYTREEVLTWSVIYAKLTKLYTKHACQEFNDNFCDFEKFCGYRENNIPQLEDISQYLKNKTGFTLRPVAGYLSSRDFLAGLAFRVFHCTQYIRHSSDPFYTPEPDCCHEILGHCPLLADVSFSQFSQEIGLASLGASDEEVDKLATCYFFTIEFGLCKQNHELKVYGAGLLSSAAELQHAVSDDAHVLAFDPALTCQQTPMITTYQEVYFFTESFMEAKEQMREFASTIKRPFGVRYNPYTQSVEILSNTRKIMALVSELKGDLCIVTNALRKIKGADGEDREVGGEQLFLGEQKPED